MNGIANGILLDSPSLHVYQCLMAIKLGQLKMSKTMVMSTVCSFFISTHLASLSGDRNLQESKNVFMDPEELCFTLDEAGDVVNYMP